MLRLARWHAPDTCAHIPPFTASCRPVACSAPYFRTPSTRPPTHPAPSDLTLYPSMAHSPPLKTHSLRPTRRTRQRLTSHDFIESARRSVPAFVPGASRRALPIKIWRNPARTRSRGNPPGPLMPAPQPCRLALLRRALMGKYELARVSEIKNRKIRT
jgi:hypothetical protein